MNFEKCYFILVLFFLNNSVFGQSTSNCKYHLVSSTDTVQSLFSRYGLSLSILQQANPMITSLQFNPPILPVGSSICIPLANLFATTRQITNINTNQNSFYTGCQSYYTSQYGETLTVIAQRYNVDINQLRAANPSYYDYLAPGTTVCFPGSNFNYYNYYYTSNQGMYYSGCTNSYTIRYGDTYNTIAAAYGTTAAAIQAANPAFNPYNLQPGTNICIPSATYNYNNNYNYNYNQYPIQNNFGCRQYHTARAGDTYATISQLYGVTVDALIGANPGIQYNNIQIGQPICIPTMYSSYYPSNYNTYTTPVYPVYPSYTNCRFTYTIRAGDTLYNLALQYGSSVQAIQTANGIVDPYTLQIGRVICIP
jgi:LysM repeat protein